MWAAYRVVFVANETPEEYKTLVKSGGASYECCPVQRTSLHRVLAKAQHKADNTVLIADETVLTAALGQDGWSELVQEAADYGLRFIPREKLIQAVAHVDHSYIDCSLLPSISTASGSLPDVVLNTHPDEHSIPPSLVRRSVPPEASNSQVAELEPPKRKLTRRFTRAKPTIIGIDDPSILDEDIPDAADPVPEPIIDPLARPSRLKRRFGPGGAQTQQPPPPSQLFSDLQSSLARTDDQDDSLKKFKSLFEETDPDKIALAEQSQTQREGVSSTTQEAGGGRMSVVREEEEETPPVSQGGAKRKAREEGEEEEDLRPPGKRRELEPPPSESSRPTQTQATEKSAPESTTAISKTTTTETLKGAKKPAGGSGGRGAAPGKPDTDTAFLKAVASTKRGKKHEDEFDREFNDLRISKPDLRSGRGAAADEARRQWEALLQDFGDDRDVRGNFMVVEVLEVFRKEEAAGVGGRASGRGLGVASERVDWDGRLDFKKFKRKGTRERRQPVELFVEDEAGYEVNAQLWKGAAASQSQSQSQSQQQRSSNNKNSSQKPPTSQTEPHRLGNNNNKNVMEDTDDVILPKSSRSHTRGAAQTQQPGSSTSTSTTTTSTGRSATRTAKVTPKNQPLFLESDDEDVRIALSPSPAEDNDMEIDDDGDSGQVLAMDEEDESPTLRSTGRRTQQQQQQQVAKPKRAGTKKRPAEVLEDSDDGAAFTGFGSRKRSRR
ncbi:hypothetical protein PHLCEN_2v5071 [Hermanssonia centrifuga]|uniref:Uncharacterized protein n=1 Tax=Hermanssonia centrifuga TaxID=98765 RepID=A0A2R6PCK5_9APHY|nr:hypothetical protein PHLCEN_2v5071 [Hermanssonia centrifuga]